MNKSTCNLNMFYKESKPSLFRLKGLKLPCFFPSLVLGMIFSLVLKLLQSVAIDSRKVGLHFFLINQLSNSINHLFTYNFSQLEDQPFVK